MTNDCRRGHWDAKYKKKYIQGYPFFGEKFNTLGKIRQSHVKQPEKHQKNCIQPAVTYSRINLKNQEKTIKAVITGEKNKKEQI